MKLYIEVEFASDEIPLATEVLRSLKALTENVKARDMRKLFAALIARLKDEEPSKVSSEIEALLTEFNGSDMVLDEFIAAFEDVVFGNGTAVRHNTILPFMEVLPRLPSNLTARMKDPFVEKVLKHLTTKRPVEASRMEFYLQAEAFAALVRLGMINLSGAIRTIITMLGKTTTRCAAITMLGKTVELNLEQVFENCDKAMLAELRDTVEAVTEMDLIYDVSYIKDTMGWRLPLPPPKFFP